MADRRRRHALAGLASLGACVLALAVLGSAVASAPAPTCAAGQLSLLFFSSNGAAGSVDREFGFRNVGPTACVLTGYPKLQMLKASGAPLSTTVHDAAGAFGIKVAPVRLAHGAIAYFDIHYPSATGYGKLSCPTSAGVQITAPGNTVSAALHGAGGRIQAFGGTTVHLHCGTVSVSAVTARRIQ